MSLVNVFFASELKTNSYKYYEKGNNCKFHMKNYVYKNFRSVLKSVFYEIVKQLIDFKKHYFRTKCRAYLRK